MSEAKAAEVPESLFLDIWAYLVPYTRDRVLHIGGGQGRIFGHWQTLDTKDRFGGKRIADIDQSGTEPLPFKDGYFQAVVAGEDFQRLKDKADLDKILAEWIRVVRKGGHLVMAWPHPESELAKAVAKVWPIEVVQAMRKLGGWDLLEDQLEKNGVYWQVYRLSADDVQNVSPWRRGEKSLLVIRYGAFGDAVHASSVLPGLKRQGWNITFNCHPTTRDVLAKDPHIDGFIVQDPNQVANHNLGAYWEMLAKRYDRTINFSEAAEGTLLTTPGSLHDQHPDEIRRVLYKQSYLGRLHDIAGVARVYEPRFYPDPGEVEYVKAQLKDVPRPWILWVMWGSSFHKIWPHMPQAMVRLLYKHPTASVILAGGNQYPEIPAGIERAVIDYHGHGHRIIRTDGVWPIRGTMTLAQLADVVVGPETGVLNAVSHDPVPKVCLLSHSAKSNLTDDWVNVYPITPVAGSTPCYPCHRLHYDWARCHKEPTTGAALCAANIPAGLVVTAILDALTPKTFEDVHGLLDTDRRSEQHGIAESPGELQRPGFGDGGGGSGEPDLSWGGFARGTGHDPAVAPLADAIDGLGNDRNECDSNRSAGEVPGSEEAGVHRPDEYSTDAAPTP